MHPVERLDEEDREAFVIERIHEILEAADRSFKLRFPHHRY